MCSATSRLLVEATIADEVLARYVVSGLKPAFMLSCSYFTARIVTCPTLHTSRLKQETSKIFLGDPIAAENRDKTGMLGPLVCRSQRDKVLSYIQGAKKEGAELVVGGGAPPAMHKGFFVQPTVFKVKPTMKIWREEGAVGKKLEIRWG